MRTIEIIVTSDGRTCVRTLGFTGPACRFTEEALGQRIAENRALEFYQATAVELQQQRT